MQAVVSPVIVHVIVKSEAYRLLSEYHHPVATRDSRRQPDFLFVYSIDQDNIPTMIRKLFCYIPLMLLPVGRLAADDRTATLPDSVLLRGVEVVAAKPDADLIPVQVLTGDELQRLNSNSVADALRYFAGVQVKDYGGVGGIKTVNIRSMGTNHTGVVYDGVELGNAQNGQIDLGQFSLDNIEAISLHNGQRSRILQPASDFGSAGTIYMRTRVPQFKEGETYHARGAVRFGSFDLINPSALVELKLSSTVSASLSAEWLNSSGKYKFRHRRPHHRGRCLHDENHHAVADYRSVWRTVRRTRLRGNRLA